MKTKRTKNSTNNVHYIPYSPHCKKLVERVFAGLDAVVDCHLINDGGEISRPRLNILTDDHTGKIVEFRLKP